MSEYDVRDEPGADRWAYEPPLVEDVVTAEALAREIHYAGNQSGPDFG
jgi:hypothetical protein